MSRLFGTDGVRGVAGQELDYDLAVALGRAAVRVLGPKIVIGRDTRVSGPMLEEALVAGISAEGGQQVALAGVIPTPAIALVTVEDGYDCGIVISASHNPPEYNGIKFFGPDGYKLPDAVEDQLQSVVEQVRGEEVPEPSAGAARKMEDAVSRYAQHAVDILTSQGVDLKGLKVALDCGHGASCESTPLALKMLGAEVFAINTDPDGAHINVECGSTHLEPVKQLLEETGADVGLAHDGDADRLLAVAPGGIEVDGDYILAICAKDMKDRGVLTNDLVVGTVMSNLGFTQALKREGIEFVAANVGDRYVLEQLKARGGILGGEQSGHVIFMDYNTTGDGLATALSLLAVMARSGKSIPELMQVMSKFPQTLINVRVTDKTLYAGNEAIAEAEEDAVAKLGSDGRLLVRMSGTEPVIRVMVEASTQGQADAVAKAVADVVKAEIGA